MSDYQDDTVYLDSRREALFILVLLCTRLFWPVSFCYLGGYTEHPRIEGEVTNLLPDLSGFDHEPAELSTPLGLGIPAWIFWGVAMPWVLCILISIWFCFFFMKDDEWQLAQLDGAGEEDAS